MQAFEDMAGIKSRCEALEMENTRLRDNIRVLNTQVVYVCVCVCVCVQTGWPDNSIDDIEID